MTEIMNLFGHIYKHQMYKFQFSSKFSFPVYIYQPSGSLIESHPVGWWTSHDPDESGPVMYILNPPTAVTPR
jgi:hypothetical protein